MKISRLVCEACGAAIESSAGESRLKCPYCGSQYLVELPSMLAPTSSLELIRRLLSSEPGSKFSRLDKAIQDTMIQDLLRLLEQNKWIESIRNVRTYTDLGLHEAKEIVDKIPALLNK